ncbi:nucleotide-binding universal stress UspA family protein [Halopolyspora algeriensis]|uniref:Nucleotide-binding universal stress UspA family protein n=1 Tax=Halopolyspora algeriensis TaxID=1500506 RepID=A0A368W381_9ACTN|nr:universal stress protein [Halopolyspora algeriensis]RCW47133.1 nucleotide-binding universal stress UspA family protein [Halopolyspora algeriensis]TQM48220.1 nucleotide-binding universal stress UspA family protein [Halopolyspora algeriensis]
MTDQTQERVIIDGGVAVGVDNSASSMRALTFAAQEAVRRGTVLHIIRAWSMRTTPLPKDWPTGTVPSVEQYEELVCADTEQLVTGRLGTDPGCEIRIHAVHSPPPQALLSASRGADLLVVGHRGRGGFSGLMLGAVAEQCVRHAACPVTVVRPSV